MNLTESIHEGYMNGLSNSKNWKTSITYANHVFTSVLVSSNFHDSVWLRDH